MENPPAPIFFATTRWTLVREAAGRGEVGAREALEQLCSLYWQPLYRYARRRGKSKEDAEDLVQGFLANLLERDALSRTNPAKGRFRSFLLTSFQRWMVNDWRAATREKRGGGQATLSFDWEQAETGLSLEAADSDAFNPDRHYDREWALALLGKVLADLEASCASEGQSRQFQILKPCLTADSTRIRHAEVAEQLGTTENAARVAVHRLRRRYRDLLTDEIRRTISPPDTVEDEMRALFSALAG